MARAYLQFSFILLMLNLSQAQLIGTISRSFEDLEVITAVITNAGSRHVSVLKHNNVFDTSHMSLPFKVTDSAGNRLPMGGSRIHYSGMSNNDLLDLAPGCNFTRHFNLTDYVDLEPKESETSKTLTISLPSTFRGLKDHDGVYQIHPAAEGRFIDGHLRFGDFSRANLTGISHSSTPFQLTLTVPARGPRKEKRQVRSGIQLVSDNGCSIPDAAKLSTAILHASYLAGAALNAASKFGDIPFNYFFPANFATASKVAGVMGRVIQSQSGQGQPIGITCKDLRKRCVGTRGQVSPLVTPAYVMQAVGYHPTIVFCPAGLTLPTNPEPCSQPPGTVSIGWDLLHEMVHVQSISGPGLDIFDETGDLAIHVGNAVKAGKDTTTDANAYSYLGTWSWDLGLGGQPWNEQKTCLDKFPTGKFTSNPFFH